MTHRKFWISKNNVIKTHMHLQCRQTIYLRFYYYDVIVFVIHVRECQAEKHFPINNLISLEIGHTSNS